jgi:hypothetical protein
MRNLSREEGEARGGRWEEEEAECGGRPAGGGCSHTQSRVGKVYLGLSLVNVSGGRG